MKVRAEIRLQFCSRSIALSSTPTSDMLLHVKMSTSVTTACIRAMLTPCVCLTLSGSALAATYWVSPTGSATWANCQSVTALNGTAACSLSTANANAEAGDTVYFRGGSGGSYVVNTGTAAVIPSHSGTCASLPCTGGSGANRIVFSAYNGEVPILAQTDVSKVIAGVWLDGKSWIRISGITFSNFKYYYAIIYHGASYNEIDHNQFISSGLFRSGYNFGVGSADGCQRGWDTHNWIHHNYLSTRLHPSGDSCAEGVDVMDIGADCVLTQPSGTTCSPNVPSNPEKNPYCSMDNYNTIESNYIEYGSHSTLSVKSQRNVVVGNILHNEPWKGNCTSWQTATSTSSVTIGTGSKTFVTQTGLSGLTALSLISVVTTSDYTQVMNGQITSYNSGTGTLVINSQHTGGSGTYDSWVISVGGLIPQYSVSAWNGMYGHRNVGIGDPYWNVDNYNLVEGNRIGFASLNPANSGLDNLTYTAPGNMGRYNFLYGAMNSGIYVKWPYPGSTGGNAYTYGYNTGTIHSYSYNNTIFQNGINWNPLLYGARNLAFHGQGIGQDNYEGAADLPTNNTWKNNLVYGNSQGDICKIGWPGNNTCAPMTTVNGTPVDTVVSNWVTTDGDPKFTNPDLSDPTSQNLIASAHGYTATPIPDLTLQATSPAIDGGAALTTAVGAGNHTATLVVADAMYFQDGTGGSDLARGVTFFPDWIAIGTVTNTVQIGSINYAANTITLASPATWSAGASIWLYKKSDGAVVLVGAGPDFGASEFGTGTRPLPPSNLQTVVR